MLNLLPQEEKKKFIQIYYVRLGIIITFFISALFMIASVGLLPSYLSGKTQTDTLIKQKQEAEAKNTSASLAEADTKIAKNKAVSSYLQAWILTLAKGDSLSKAISKIFDQKTPAISIDTISFDGQNLSIAGVSATRSDLINFSNNLKDGGYFKNVALPISDIAKSTDAPFTIELTLQ